MFRIYAIQVLLLIGLLAANQRAFAESLQDAWAIAIASNAELAAVALEQDAAGWDLHASRSFRYPNGTLQSGYIVRSDTPSFRSSTPGLADFPYAQREAFSTKAEVRSPLYTSGRIKNAIHAAEAQLAIAHSKTRNTHLDLLRRIGEAYFSVLREQREWEVAEQDVATLATHEKEVDSLFQLSRVPHNDLLAAQVTTAQAVQYRLMVHHRLQDSRAAYNRLLGRPLVLQFELAECAFPWLEFSVEQLVAIAWEKHPELSSIRAAADAKYFESQRILAERNPQLHAVGSFQYEENRFQDPQSLASAAVVLDWKLLDGGRSKRKAQAELARAASLRRVLCDLKSQIGLELSTLFNARAEAAQRRELAIQTLKQAEESLRVSKLRYSQGLAINSDVLDAQSRYTKVKRDLYNAGYDLALAQLRLRHSAGVLSASSL